MSNRAEEASSTAAYGWQSDKEGNMTLEMFPEPFRRGFVKGYEQAEKDLALTWEDAKKIDDLFMGVATLFAMVGRNKDILEQPYYEEVAKRFNEQRKK